MSTAPTTEAGLETCLVEERLARANALVLALESAAQREGDFPGNLADVCGWLRIMAVEELTKVRAVLGRDVTDRPC